MPLPCQRVRKWHGAERGETKGGGRVREPSRRGGWRTGGGLERKRLFLKVPGVGEVAGGSLERKKIVVEVKKVAGGEIQWKRTGFFRFLFWNFGRVQTPTLFGQSP